jgi:hypothetical protein
VNLHQPAIAAKLVVQVLVGAEPNDASLECTKSLRQFHSRGAAKSDAVDPTLQELIDTWADLPEAVRGAVLVMVRAAVSK